MNFLPISATGVVMTNFGSRVTIPITTSPNTETNEPIANSSSRIIHLPPQTAHPIPIQLLSGIKKALRETSYVGITEENIKRQDQCSLATTYAYQNRNAYEIICWIDCTTKDSLISSFRKLGKEMGIGDEFLSDDKVIELMKNVLENRTKWLLIFNDVEDAKTLHEIMPDKGGHSLVISNNCNIIFPLISNSSARQAQRQIKDNTYIVPSEKGRKLQSLAQELSAKPHTDIAANFTNLAQNMIDQRRFAFAKEHFEKAIEIYDTIGIQNHMCLAKCYQGIGNILSAEGDLNGAIEMFQKALKTAIAALGGEGTMEASSLYSRLATLYENIGEKQKAQEMKEKANSSLYYHSKGMVQGYQPQSYYEWGYA